MNNKLKRIVAIAVMTTSGAIAFAAPAFAATYSGRGDYTRQLDSVSLEATAAGRHLVYTKATCTAASISVELYQDFYFEPNTPLGRKASHAAKIWVQRGTPTTMAITSSAFAVMTAR